MVLVRVMGLEEGEMLQSKRDPNIIPSTSLHRHEVNTISCLSITSSDS